MFTARISVGRKSCVQESASPLSELLLTNATALRYAARRNGPTVTRSALRALAEDLAEQAAMAARLERRVVGAEDEPRRIAA